MYKIILASLVTALVSWSALAADAPTRIIVNGVVLTMDKNDRRAECRRPDGYTGSHRCPSACNPRRSDVHLRDLLVRRNDVGRRIGRT